MSAIYRWLCRHNFHPWRRGGRDVAGNSYYICRVCGVIGAVR